MGCYDVFCTLCGGALNTTIIWDSLRSSNPRPGGAYWDYNQNLVCDEDLEWLRDVRIIAEWQSKTDQDKQVNAKARIYYASEFDACMGPFDATDSHGLTHWCHTFAKGENEGNYPGNYFVMHSACLLVAQRWMYEEEKSVQDFYTALCVYDLDLFRGVYLPDRHYGAEYFWEQFWVAKQDWEFIVKDPVNVPGMTEYILSKLRAVPLEDDKQLPDEDVQSSDKSQDHYRKQLLSGHLFAMEDLNLGLIMERWHEIKDKDWRRLVRSLARYENFDAGEDGSGPLGELHDAPIGLRNRMRIVKMIQSIFVGT